MAFFSRPQSSSAIKIVNPNTQDELRPQSRKDSVQRQCRNIMIYGSCKYQDKGCTYYHPPAPDTPKPTESPAIGSLTAQAVNAPVFVPKAAAASVSFPQTTSPPPLSASRQSSVASLSPPSPTPQADYQDFQPQDAYDNYPYSGDLSTDSLTNQMADLDSQFYDVGGVDATYYSGPPDLYIREPLNYHLYTNAIPPAFISAHSDSHFVPSSSDLRQVLQTRSETIRGAPAPGLNLPEELQGYHTLVPLESSAANERRKFGSWYSTVYRAINSAEGAPYTLRRVENYRLMHQSAFTAIEAWSRIRHPNIVLVREAFTTRAFGDNSLVVAYAYHAGARTLYDTHFKPQPPTIQPSFIHNRSHIQLQPTTIPERTIWSYIIQIASAIKKVHEAGLAVRMIDVSKILLTGKNRIRISSCGIVDVLMYDAQQDIHMLQLEDLSMFGRLIIALCCTNASAASGSNFQKSLEIMAQAYSPEIKNVALFLISKNNPHRNIVTFFEIIHNKVISDMDDALEATDRLENELMGELENARLVRLLCKFGFINERPEFARDPRWSETGDRYIIKLFRDYVFHQLDENGNPVTNLSHVLTCLNKLDAGSEEKLMLIAPDEQSCLVVSYKEIKLCVEAAFSDLARAGSTSYRV
ncbi:uncharacterized protein BT62DRAFT_931175 [Guyanagaster necrorhizus]|uniref:PAN2-PAN3 deadenylation complex subunit PAN3 n=1 Tax=Guyanagaster necrorhizus TaxID=856835 RepID=A0A9P8ATD7_9AGAR|nr:uncharacterized protein BT62DRAFT_931175 [Guyanagaster necrorhizus MCA 3950]KAG7447333.1 hypothetical protein BT62DRAFT_931175 [Guyanagaster necrorhizus MCA 3950]